MSQFVPLEPSGRLDGKVAIITGSSSGLGEALAVRMASEGASVALTGRDEARLNDAGKKCREAAEKGAKKKGEKVKPGDKVLLVLGDVSSSETRRELVDKTLKTFGRLDILVNNAGIFPAQDAFVDATEEKFDELFSVNVKAGFFLAQHALPHLEKTKGNVLFTSSCLSDVCINSSPMYAASKAAVDNLVRNLASILTPRGVRVNGINPSYIPTLGVRDFLPAGADFKTQKSAADARADMMGPLHPARRCASPEEFAEAALFIVSPQAAYMTGESLFLDGGARLPSVFSQ